MGVPLYCAKCRNGFRIRTRNYAIIFSFSHAINSGKLFGFYNVVNVLTPEEIAIAQSIFATGISI
jgi:hypothetical protein